MSGRRGMAALLGLIAAVLGMAAPALAGATLDSHRIASERFGNDAPW